MYHGLELDLFVGEFEKYHSMNGQSGIRVFIYGHYSVFSDTEGFDIAPGTATNIGLKFVKSTSLKEPYSSCQVDESAIATREVLRFRNNNIIYRQIDCLDLCYQEILIENCDCVDSFVNYFIDIFNKKNKSLSKFCRSSRESKSCLDDVIEQSESVCFDKCPLECSKMYYRTTMDFSNVSIIL